MEQTFTALLSMSRGRWRLYVALMNTTDPWPEHRFGRTGRVPTFTQRAAALSRLGFEPVEGAVWEWTEDTAVHGDPSATVVLIASTRVRTRTGVGA
ncbi:DUF6303 family protein [Streptomyces sp. NPDC090106]|uniref:DUF6303 family protein n=1 Tax=Streptomyces sp. NPDC090106 TaxID=3365946 RepID=UPI00380ED179